MNFYQRLFDEARALDYETDRLAIMADNFNAVGFSGPSEMIDNRVRQLRAIAARLRQTARDKVDADAKAAQESFTGTLRAVAGLLPKEQP